MSGAVTASSRCATATWRIDRIVCRLGHYGDVIMGAVESQITSLTIVYSTVYSDADQRKHQSSASLVFVWGIHRGPVNSPHKWPVTRKMIPFDDVIMCWCKISTWHEFRVFYTRTKVTAMRIEMKLCIVLPLRLQCYCKCQKTDVICIRCFWSDDNGICVKLDLSSELAKDCQVPFIAHRNGFPK